MLVHTFIWLFLLNLLAVGLSAPTPNATTGEPEPCALVSAAVADILKDKPPGWGVGFDQFPTIPASMAIDCVKSVPFNATYAVEWLNSFRPYLKWQSTLAYLKNPPPGYWREPYDLMGRLEAMINRANANGWEDEYMFEMDLYKMFGQAYDGHMRYFPRIFTGVFSFGRPMALVSVSPDGISPPVPFAYDDILQSVKNPAFKPSPITKILNVDAELVLKDFALWGTSLDQDAAYNTLFMNLAQSSLGNLGNGAGIFAGGGRGSLQYPGSHTNITFANDTIIIMENFARVKYDFTNIKSGQDLRSSYLLGDEAHKAVTPDPGDADELADVVEALDGPPGYPRPIRTYGSGSISGFYVNGTDYEHLAVLAISSFSGIGYPTDYQQAAAKFLDQAKRDGKTKLIIDLSANGGGMIQMAFSIFKMLFPDLDPYGGTRFHAFGDFDLLGQIVSDAVGGGYPWRVAHPPGPSYLDEYVATPFIATADLDVNGHSFKSWGDKYGPHQLNGDQFTSVIRWNMSDTMLIEYAKFDPYGGFSNLTANSGGRPFAVEDMVILTDGYCASTCSLFAEFMTQQAKVKTVAVGGQGGPDPGAMQAVGGVRGANVYLWSTIKEFADDGVLLAQGTPREVAANNNLKSYSHTPFSRASDSGGQVNVRNSVRLDDDEQIPLQFRYQKADCRMFYTMEHTVDMTTLWKSVYDVTWRGARCAQGAISPRQDTSSEKRSGGIKKRQSLRTMHEDEIQQLRDVWKYANDVDKIKPMAGFQLP